MVVDIPLEQFIVRSVSFVKTMKVTEAVLFRVQFTGNHEMCVVMS